MERIDAISRRTPHLCSMSPGGKHYMYDLYRAGGIGALMRRLGEGNLLETGCLTATGEPLELNLEVAPEPDDSVIRPLADPVHREGGIAVLKRNLAPSGPGRALKLPAWSIAPVATHRGGAGHAMAAAAARVG